MSIMLPAMATTKPAPAERDASVILSVHPVGAPRSLGLSENEYWVLAIHTGNLAKHQSLNCCSLARAFSLKVTPAAPYPRRHALDLFLQRIIKAVNGLHVRLGIFFDGLDHLLGQSCCAIAALGVRLA